MHAHQVDRLTGARAGRLAELAGGPGARYPHLIHVGAGWAFAPLRLPWAPTLPATPLLRWLGVDGAGFAEAFFGGHRAVRRRIRGRHTARGEIVLTGTGRALWFLESADPRGVATIIDSAPSPARGPLWSGVGLAVTYAGGATDDEIAALVEFASGYREHLGQGAAFAATARSRAGDIDERTSTVIRQVVGQEPSVVATWADEAGRDLEERDDLDAYHLWRARLRLAVSGRPLNQHVSPGGPA